MRNQDQYEFTLTISIYVTPTDRSGNFMQLLQQTCAEVDDLRRYEPVPHRTKIPGKVDLRINFHSNSLDAAEEKADYLVDLVVDSIKSNLGNESFREGSSLLTYA